MVLRSSFGGVEDSEEKDPTLALIEGHPDFAESLRLRRAAVHVRNFRTLRAYSPGAMFSSVQEADLVCGPQDGLAEEIRRESCVS